MRLSDSVRDAIDVIDDRSNQQCRGERLAGSERCAVPFLWPNERQTIQSLTQREDRKHWKAIDIAESTRISEIKTYRTIKESGQFDSN